MRILIVGAGAIGGYFGGRLLQAGRDVTFLVRPRRAAQLHSWGLSISSPTGNLSWAEPPTIQSAGPGSRFDLIVLACKAYDLQGAIESFAPAVGRDTTILPLLNGLGHLAVLQGRFGVQSVLGGQCVISAALDAQGRVLHLNDSHALTYGELSGPPLARTRAIQEQFANAGFEPHLSESIRLEMWEKWVFIAAAAGITCLLRSAIGDILAAGGKDLIEELLRQCASIARHAGFEPREQSLARSRSALTAPGSTITASMLRDVEQGNRTEVEQILGDLLRRGGDDTALALLRTAYVHVKAYEARRAREMRIIAG